MDTSIDPQQEERAIAHIAGGVFMDELSPAGRVRVVRHLCDTYVSDWPSTPPGFTPWGRRRQGKELFFDEGLSLAVWVMPILLRAYGSVLTDTSRLRGDLLLTNKGELLFEHDGRKERQQAYKLSVCTEEQLLQLVANGNYYGIIIRMLRSGLKKKRENLVRELELTDEKLGILNRVSDEWRDCSPSSS